MSGSSTDGVRNQLVEAWRLLEAGRSREAADAFGRFLLQDPGSAEARRGLRDARAAAAEEARLLDERMEEARAALESGEHDTARTLLEDVIRRGGDRDRALAWLDRLEERRVRVEAPAWPAAAPSEEAPPSSPPRRRTWSRRAFAAGWAFAIAALTLGLVLSWDRFVYSLVRTPAPEAREALPAGGGSAQQGQAR